MKRLLPIAALLLLAGCSTPRWSVGDADFVPDSVSVFQEDDPTAKCAGKSSIACAIRIRHAMIGRQCLVFVRKSLAASEKRCAVRHEISTHCVGIDHDTRPVYRQDCGELT